MRIQGRVPGVCLAAVITVAAVACESPQEDTLIPAPAMFEDIRAGMQARIEAGELPSVSVSVIDDGVVIWRETLGFSNLETRELARPEQVYALGSLAKSISASLVLTLVEDGAIELDATVNDYLSHPVSNVAGDRAPTIRELLQMVGGTPHGHRSFPEAEAADADEPVTPRVLGLPPGENYLYSNYAFGLLEAVVEEVTGMPFADAAEARLFEPLGMTSARFGALGSGPDDVALHGWEGEIIAPFEWQPYAAGGVSASSLDLERYALFHMGRLGENSPLDATTLDLMHTAFPDGIEAPIMALGIGSLELDSGARWLITDGSVDGGMSSLFMLPESGDAVIVLINANGDSDVVNEAAAEMLDVLNPGFASEMVTAARRVGAAHYAPFDAPADLLGDWCGDFGGVWQVRMSLTGGSTVALALNGGESAQTEAYASGTLFSGGTTMDDLRVQYNFAPHGDGISGYVVTTDAGESLGNDVPVAGVLSRCG